MKEYYLAKSNINCGGVFLSATSNAEKDIILEGSCFHWFKPAACAHNGLQLPKHDECMHAPLSQKMTANYKRQDKLQIRMLRDLYEK